MTASKASANASKMRPKQLLLLSVAALSCGVSAISPSSSLATSTKVILDNNNSNNHHYHLASLVLRGGSSSSSSPKKTKKKKKKTGKAKKAINNAMKEKDAAEALGDAIRDRADVLREEDPFLQSVSWSISSLGAAIGASDRRRMDGGGVEAATNSVLAHYFLKSHGGAHALQCFCSLLATLSGLGAILFQKSAFGFVLLQRTFLFAMIKHVSGLLAGASLAAKAIPKIGLAEARQWIEQLVLDPVSQYVFYTAVLLLWLPSKQRLDACWWWKQKLIPSILLVPILVREIISNILVTSDVLVLWSVGGEGASTGIETLLKVSNSIINAAMSLVVSPQIWRSADPAERQTILAKLVGRLSLAFEAAVGMVLLADLGLGFFLTAFGGSNRPPFRESLTKLLCVRLYLHFLWVRRKKIGKLAVKLRGGATQLPFWFLDVVYNPVKSMGLEISKDETSDDPSKWTWREYLPIALGLDQ